MLADKRLDVGNVTAGVQMRSGYCLTPNEWRRGGDSNPRYGFPYSSFQDWRHQPLGHLSDYYSFTTVQAFSQRQSGIVPLFSIDYKRTV